MPQFTTNQAMVDSLRERVHDERVLQAMAAVDRSAFVPEKLAAEAYDNTPLPIGGGQTISQPLMVALMTEALRLTGDERVLELGTGSGYQAAILGRLAAHVVTVERITELTERTATVLAALGIATGPMAPQGSTMSAEVSVLRSVPES